MQRQHPDLPPFSPRRLRPTACVRSGVILTICFLLTILLLGAAPTYAAGTEFYIAPDGDDANPGTLEQPFATLEGPATPSGLSKMDPACLKAG